MDAAAAIEALVVQFVRALAAGRLSSVGEAAADHGIAAVSDRRKRARDGAPAESQLDTTPEAAERRVRRIVAEWSVLGLAHQLLRSGRTCTIRDLYYCGAGTAFRSQEDAGRAIQAVCNILGTHRHRLGLHASVRPAVPIAWTASRLACSHAPARVGLCAVPAGQRTRCSAPKRQRWQGCAGVHCGAPRRRQRGASRADHARREDGLHSLLGCVNGSPGVRHGAACRPDVRSSGAVETQKAAPAKPCE